MDKIEPMDWEEIIMNVENPVWDNINKRWRIIQGYKKDWRQYFIKFTDADIWWQLDSVELYLKKL